MAVTAGSCLFVSVPQLKVWDSPSVEREGSMWNRFPTVVCSVIHIHHSESCTLSSGISAVEFAMSGRLVQLTVVMTLDS